MLLKTNERWQQYQEHMGRVAKVLPVFRSLSVDVKIIQWEEDLKSHELFESGGDDIGDGEDGENKVKM